MVHFCTNVSNPPIFLLFLVVPCDVQFTKGFQIVWKFLILRSVIPLVYIRTTVDQWSRNSSQKNTTIFVCTM